MKFRTQKLKALMLTVVLGTSAVGSMSVMAAENTKRAESEEAEAVETEGDAISADMISGTFKPSETTVPAQDSYEYPFLGMKFSIPKALQKQMKKQSIAMVTTEDETSQVKAVTYAYVSWNEMTEEQKNAEVEKQGTGYEDWVASLKRIGTLGVYDEDSQKKLDELTGCTEHKELGSSKDGKYKYYLSLNKTADKKLKKELEEIKTTITEMAEYQDISMFDQPQDANVDSESATSVGKFETKGIDGETYTEKMFSDYDLTLVNIFATWCSPCVKEIPDLQKLSEELKEKGVGVVGVVMDAADENGNPDEESVKKAGVLQDKTKASYPFLIPDTTMMNGRLKGISAFPESFFVDKNGNIVGETYTGSHTLDEWKEIVGKELKNVSK